VLFEIRTILVTGDKERGGKKREGERTTAVVLSRDQKITSLVNPNSLLIAALGERREREREGGR